MNKDLRVLVGVPSGTHWQAEFGMSLVNLMGYFALKVVPGYKSQELRVANVRSSILPKNRLDLVKMAKSANVDFLLFVDTDHKFPPNMLHRLISKNQPIVALNCPTKTLPSSPTARAFDPQDPQGRPVYSNEKAVGMQRVWRIGTGVMLIRRDALEKIPHSSWAMVYKEEADTFQGEDWTFCAAAEALDIPLYIDHDLSKEVGHVGNFTYMHSHVTTPPEVPG